MTWSSVWSSPTLPSSSPSPTSLRCSSPNLSSSSGSQPCPAPSFPQAHPHHHQHLKEVDANPSIVLNQGNEILSHRPTTAHGRFMCQWNIDSNGFAIYLDPKSGAMFVIVGRRKFDGVGGSHLENFSEVDIFLNKFEAELPNADRWDLEAVILTPRTRL